LRRWFDLITLQTEELGVLLAREEGKPLAEAKAEIIYAASFVEWFCRGSAARLWRNHPAAGHEILILKQPIGVTTAITPWNFPSAMITRKIAPALAAGCTSVVKPAEKTPMPALALGAGGGIPDGVINILPSTRAHEIGLVLTTHPLVRKVSFTGSTAVGRTIMRQSSGTIKKLSLELGGNAPFIVFDDADLNAAVTGAIASKFRNSGKTCVCANCFYVQAGIYDSFAEKFAKAAIALKIGPPFEPGVEQGPLITSKALAKVESLSATHWPKAALAGAARHPLGGTFYEPTVLVDVPEDARLLREEIFGPVAISTTEAPFGGVKQSGIGREGSHYGIE